MTAGPARVALVIGAGAAGLGAAGALQRAGIDVTVLERAEHVGASWRSRYDDLRLNTPGWMSGLAGYRATIRKYGEFPTRDEWVRYLEDYTADQRIRVEQGVTVCRVDRAEGGWLVETSTGPRTADIVVVATGPDLVPRLPDSEGTDDFTGELVHSAHFRNAAPYRGRDVLVIGPNVSGIEIATLLVRGGARRVRVAVRTPPNIVTRKVLGLSINLTGIVLQRLPLWMGDQISYYTWRLKFGRLDHYGLSRSPEGVATTARRRRVSPAYDDGFVALVKAGQIEVVPAVTGFDHADVLLANGSRVRPDTVIAATGYRRGLEPLVGHLGLLDDNGFPIVQGGEQHPSAPGLFFNGYFGNLSGQLRMMRLGARDIARAVTSETTP